MPYASNNNAVLIDDCNNLQNLSVLLEVTEDIATTDGSGWSFQLQCYPPPGEYCQTSQLTVLQYIVVVKGGSLSWYIQYWANESSSWPPDYKPIPGTSPQLPCWAHDYGLARIFAGIDGDTLPRGSKLKVALGTEDSGGVNSVTFTYTDPDGNDYPASFEYPQLPPIAVHPVVACELNLVGAPGGSATFTQGLTNSRGIIYYSISSGQLSVQSGGPGAACGEYEGKTQETSNMSYSDIDGAPAGTVTQTLQQPVSCALGDLFGAERAQLDEMRQIRDSKVSQFPAGQWLIEILRRDSASLALVVASDKSDLGGTARDLLTKAAQTIRQGSVFDNSAIDDALKILGRASCKLPPSMHAVGPAATTVLESLRGRTLEDGLKAASRTIRPRFGARGG